MNRTARFVGISWLVALACTAGMGTAWGQWLWVDGNGNKVFSDTEPPADIPASRILRRPSERPAPPARPPAPPAPVAAPGAATPQDKKIPPLEAQKQQAEEAEKAKEKAAEQKAALVRAELCQRAQRQWASLGTDKMLRTMNEKGERVFMSEDTRNAEKARLQQAMQQNCTR